MGGVRFGLPVLLALLLGVFAYQLPQRTHINVGELGDQLFLPSSEAQGADQIERGAWYSDQLGNSERYRWSRANAAIDLPGLGRGHDARLTLFAAGWPDDVIVPQGQPRQPTVEVKLGGQTLTTFTTTAAVEPHLITIPDALQTSSDLGITLSVTPTFTNTTQYVDARPKGIRLDAIEVESGGARTIPDWRVLGSLVVATALTMGAARARSRRSWLVLLLGSGIALLGATAIIIARPWLAALLPSALIMLCVLVALAYWRGIGRIIRSVRWRLHDNRASDWGLLAALALLGAYVVTRLLLRIEPTDPGIIDVTSTSADRVFEVLVRISLTSAALLAIVASVTVLPRWVLALRHALLTGRTAAIMLALCAGIWLGYETWLIRTLPFVGHADYADNAVVARNLLRGRGWVVDYVTQFYALVPNHSVTRPQETWPLLQPLLMLPSMALFGPTPFAARLPNIVFLIVLTLLLYHIGSRVWDRRVGLLAVLLTLPNIYFFRLAVYATSDLALVVWSMTAFWLVFRAVEDQRSKVKGQRRGLQKRRFILHFSFFILHPWFWAGVFTSLMILQKPSSAIFALGMGLWVIGYALLRRGNASLWQTARRWLPPLTVWALTTIALLVPYLVRNQVVFGKSFFSTEAYDAWILYFRGTSDEAWEDIYKIYATALGGPGLPNRSWILRWGWDLTLGKLAQQARDAWNFFLPTKGQLLGWDASGIAATWLMLLGLITLRRRQRALVALVTAALIPYTLFLIVYWHTHEEPRYFVAFLPWLALLAAWGACWLFDRIALIGQGRWTAWGGLAISAALVVSIAPHWRRIDSFLTPQSKHYWGRTYDTLIEASAWLQANTPKDAVIMTRVPWQLNFYADRPALMIPNGTYEQIMYVNDYYHAAYLLTNAGSTSQPERKGGALNYLSTGAGMPCWELVHTIRNPRPSDASLYIYRVPSAQQALSPACPRTPIKNTNLPEAPVVPADPDAGDVTP